MALFLVQHGTSVPKEIDPECPLTDEGRDTVERIARSAAGHKIEVSLIKHSGKTRARQTADIMAYFLKPPGGVQEVSGLNPLDDVTLVAKGLPGAENVMLVGHLPFMERLVSYLITGATDRIVVKFQNGGIVCLDRA
ncbi:MAG: phosphohistidine phosphatase SixA [Proteobacteria bacterium]|nr:phosphohistidine phosphatase SixA [Pseudomonadota bacterium]